jgi:hypothetical protein
MATPTGTSPERRRRSRNQRVPPVEVRLRPIDGSGGGWQSAVLVDTAEAGIGVQSRYALAVGTPVMIEASEEMLAAVGPVPARGRVAWIRRTNSGLVRFGVAFQQPEAKPEEKKPDEPAAQPETAADYYELLQVHPKATAEMVNRAFRLLAQVYHPDNSATGDEGKFRALLTAHKTLSDDALRAAYDLERNASLKTIWNVFGKQSPATGLAAERQKRHGILAALFQKRAAEPHAPSMSVFELEEILGTSREQLEFTLWYLRERSLVTRSDNNRFQITVEGVDGLERLETSAEEGSRRFDSGRIALLPSPGAK